MQTRVEAEYVIVAICLPPGVIKREAVGVHDYF